MQIRLLVGVLLPVVTAIAQENPVVIARRLGDENAGVRRAAADELAKLGPKAAKAASRLAAALADENGDVARAAGRALAAIGKPAIKWIRRGLGERKTLQGAMVAVGSLGADGAVLVSDVLEVFRKNEDAATMDAAIVAIKGVGASAVPFLRKGTKVRVYSTYAAQLLLELGELAASAQPELMAMLANKGELSQSRIHAATALGRIGAAAHQQVDNLLEFACDEKDEPEVRIAALSAIGWIGTDDTNVDDAIKHLTKAADPRLAKAAKRVLGQLAKGRLKPPAGGN